MGYKVLSNLRHNDTTYEAGQVVTDIDEETARGLVADGVLENEEPTATEERSTEDVVTQPEEQPEAPVVQPPAEPEAPATDVPLDVQPAQPNGSSTNSDEDLPIEEQVKANLAKDKEASSKLAEDPGKPVQPTASDIQADLADV